jgi:DNA-directed RNA polymerase specialized sigma24 family protein
VTSDDDTGRHNGVTGRRPDPLEAAHLDLLVSLHQRARRFSTYYDERLEDFVRELRENGCSARSIAAAVGVSGTTVQTWTRRARERRQAGGEPSSSSPLDESNPP